MRTTRPAICFKSGFENVIAVPGEPRAGGGVRAGEGEGYSLNAFFTFTARSLSEKGFARKWNCSSSIISSRKASSA